MPLALFYLPKFKFYSQCTKDMTFRQKMDRFDCSGSMSRIYQKAKSVISCLKMARDVVNEGIEQLRSPQQTIYPANFVYQLDDEVASRTLVFLHIPKTAGTTLLRILQGISCYYNFQNTRIPVSSYSPPVLITPGWQGAIKDLNAERYALLPSRLNIISGHFPFGTHQALTPEANYVTILRNPVEREISSFNHHFQRGVLGTNDSLESLIESSKIMDNPQTRLLAGPSACLASTCNEDIFILAKKNLEAFTLFGVHEHFEEFVSELLSLYGWPAVRFKHQRISSTKHYQTISASLREDLELFHSYDLKLHDYASKYWKQKAKTSMVAELSGKDKQNVLNIPWHFQFSKKVTLTP